MSLWQGSWQRFMWQPPGLQQRFPLGRFLRAQACQACKGLPQLPQPPCWSLEVLSAPSAPTCGHAASPLMRHTEMLCEELVGAVQSTDNPTVSCSCKTLGSETLWFPEGNAMSGDTCQNLQFSSLAWLVAHATHVPCSRCVSVGGKEKHHGGGGAPGAVAVAQDPQHLHDPGVAPARSAVSCRYRCGELWKSPRLWFHPYRVMKGFSIRPCDLHWPDENKAPLFAWLYFVLVVWGALQIRGLSGFK